MLGPWINERHVLARLHHMGAGIPADGTRTDDCYLPTHGFPPAFLAAEDSALGGLNQNRTSATPSAVDLISSGLATIVVASAVRRACR